MRTDTSRAANAISWAIFWLWAVVVFAALSSPVWLTLVLILT